MMRILALIAVVWSFVGMPMLCQAGVLVECCAPAAPLDAESAECPDPCPNHDCPDDTKTPEQCECSTCLEACNVLSPHLKQVGDHEVAAMFVAVTTSTEVYLPPQQAPRQLSTEQLSEHIPIPVSDQPLLI